MRLFGFLPVFFAAAVFSGVDGGREKRYLYIDPEAPITLGFLIIMPVSLALPTLASVNGRSLQFLTPAEGEEIPDDLLWEPAYEEQLGRLSAYFTHLELPTMSCQERLLCELAADPDSFSPIGEIFMKELRLNHGPVKNHIRLPHVALYFLSKRRVWVSQWTVCSLLPHLPIRSKQDS